MRARFDHAFHSWTRNDARQNGVYRNAVRPEFLGKTLRKSDNSPLSRGIGSSERISQTAGRRRHIDYRPAAGCFQHRYCTSRNEKLRGQVNLDATAPLFGIDVFNRAGGTSNPGIVD